MVYKGLTHHYLRIASAVGASLKEGNCCELGINPFGISYVILSNLDLKSFSFLRTKST